MPRADVSPRCSRRRAEDSAPATCIKNIDRTDRGEGDRSGRRYSRRTIRSRRYFFGALGAAGASTGAFAAAFGAALGAGAGVAFFSFTGAAGAAGAGWAGATSAETPHVGSTAAQVGSTAAQVGSTAASQGAASPHVASPQDASQQLDSQHFGLQQNSERHFFKKQPFGLQHVGAQHFGSQHELPQPSRAASLDKVAPPHRQNATTADNKERMTRLRENETGLGIRAGALRRNATIGGDKAPRTADCERPLRAIPSGDGRYRWGKSFIVGELANSQHSRKKAGLFRR